jgi:hypothetical protein
MAGRLNRKELGIADTINGYLLKCKMCSREEEKRIILENCEDCEVKYHQVYCGMLGFPRQ